MTENERKHGVLDMMNVSVPQPRSSYAISTEPGQKANSQWISDLRWRVELPSNDAAFFFFFQHGRSLQDASRTGKNKSENSSLDVIDNGLTMVAQFSHHRAGTERTGTSNDGKMHDRRRH